MRKITMLVFDDFIPSNAQVFTAAVLNDRLGQFDHLVLNAVADQSAGTNPTLAAQISHSSDQRNWTNKNGTAEIPATAIPVGATTSLVGWDSSPNNPTLGFVRIGITLAGTSPAAHVKLYVTARDDAAG